MASLTRDHTEVALNMHAAIDPDKGQIESILDHDQLELTFSAIHPDATWLELALHLENPLWLHCSRIWLKLQAKAETATHLRPALRLIRPEGFRDQFASIPAHVTPEITDYSTDFSLSPNHMEKVERIALHFFFPPEENKISLCSLVLTGVV